MKSRYTSVAAVVLGLVAGPLAMGEAFAATPKPTPSSPQSTSYASPTESNTPTETPSDPSLDTSTSDPSSETPSSSDPSSPSPSTSDASSVGSHVRNVPGLSSLGQPQGAEFASADAGGGYIQYFENGWALVPSAGKGGKVVGQGGVLTGAALSYFRSHGSVNNVGWPSGNATDVTGGTWQNFTSNGNARRGAITTSAAGVFTVKGAIYDYYRANSLAGRYGAATSETPYALPTRAEQPSYWHGKGYVQRFAGGMVTVSASGKKGAVASALLPVLNIGQSGWPTSGTYTQCGGLKVSLENGAYASSGNRWCPDSAYLQPSLGAYSMTGGQNVSLGMNGIKVWKIQNRLIQLGILKNFRQTTLNSTMGPATQRAVRTFQSRNKLGVTGVVDASTWAKLVGPSMSFALDAWKQPSLVSAVATRDARVNTMVAWAKAHAAKGTPYIWGGTGWWGYDCSGFLLQAMRAGGVDPKRVNNFADTRSASDLSYQMFRDGEFQRGSFSHLKPGDFIYYGDSKRVRHVAMFIGQNTVVNENGTRAALANVRGRVAGWPNSAVWGVNRPFAL